LRQAGDAVDRLSKQIFSGEARQKPEKQFEVLRALGRSGDMISQVRETLVSVERMLRFLSNDGHASCAAVELLMQAKTTLRDHQSLEEHAGFVSGKVQFLLDAVLGLVNLEQNNIIKLFSVISVVLTPPTLLASIFGMNFKFMPELNWEYGYPYAVCLMLASAILPYVYFKWRKWL
jgi:magnesium transporter